MLYFYLHVLCRLLSFSNLLSIQQVIGQISSRSPIKVQWIQSASQIKQAIEIECYCSTLATGRYTCSGIYKIIESARNLPRWKKLRAVLFLCQQYHIVLTCLTDSSRYCRKLVTRSKCHLCMRNDCFHTLPQYARTSAHQGKVQYRQTTITLVPVTSCLDID